MQKEHEASCDDPGLERKRGLAHAVLSAWWSLEENTGWEYAASFAEMIADLDIK